MGAFSITLKYYGDTNLSSMNKDHVLKMLITVQTLFHYLAMYIFCYLGLNVFTL